MGKTAAEPTTKTDTGAPGIDAAVGTSGKPSFGDIPLECIRASKTNPRKIFGEEELNGLAASIKKQGVAQPILVRPLETVGDVTYFEIVAGERRFRASRIAGMPTVPAIVRHLGDRDAYEIQVLENLQRVDLHPLEEAEGFEALMNEYKATADELAEKVGKSRAYIYASLKLCALEAGPRKSFYAGLLTKSTALLVARIPVKALQQKCVGEITTGYSGPMSTRNAAEHIERNYMLHLKKATFKPSDATLCPAAGSCTDCPNRTGNQPEIFTDVGADVCTDPVCFKAKGEAHVIRIKQLATANGQTVLSGAEAKKIMPSAYSDLGGGYVDLDKPNYLDAKNRTYRQILGKDVPAIALLESPHSERILEIVKVSDIKPLLEAKGVGLRAKTREQEQDSRAIEKAQEAAAKIEREYRNRLYLEIHHASLLMNLVDQDLRLVALLLFNNLPSNTTPTALVMSLYGWSNDTTFAWPDRGAKVKAAIDALTPAQLNQFIRDCSLSGELHVNTYTSTSKDAPQNLLGVAARVKVDAMKIRADVKAEAKEKVDAKQRAFDKKAGKLVSTPSSVVPPMMKVKAAKPAAKKAPAPKSKAAAKAKFVPPLVPAPAKPVLKPEAAWPFPTTSRPRTATTNAVKPDDAPADGAAAA